MRPMPVDVNADTRDLLHGADFADAFAFVVVDPTIDAMVAAERAMASPPRWVGSLMLLRDMIVMPLGLRTVHDISRTRTRRVGAFPILSQAPDRVVLGFDDKHQDFRVAVDVAVLDEHRRKVTMTTLVRTHNLLGRTYLAMVMPFHRRVVPSMMMQIERPKAA
jgi:hypothetical protein